MLRFLLIFLNDLANGMPIFPIAAGFTLIFDVMGVLNFAHSRLYMLGAFDWLDCLPWTSKFLASSAGIASVRAFVVGAIEVVFDAVSIALMSAFNY